MFSISNTFTFHGRKTVSPWSPFTFEADEFSRSFGPIQADWNAWNSKPHKKGRNVSGITEYWRQYGAIGEGRPVKKHEKELQGEFFSSRVSLTSRQCRLCVCLYAGFSISICPGSLFTLDSQS